MFSRRDFFIYLILLAVIVGGWLLAIYAAMGNISWADFMWWLIAPSAVFWVGVYAYQRIRREK